MIKLKLSNLKEIVARANKLARSMTNGSGSKELVAESESIVAKEYKDAFAKRGFAGGDKWRSSKGPVSLIDTEDFKNSFANVRATTSRSGSGSLSIMMESDFTHPGMRSPYVKALRYGMRLGGASEVNIQIDISGPEGGVSKTGRRLLFKKFKEIFYGEARRAGYSVS